MRLPCNETRTITESKINHVVSLPSNFDFIFAVQYTSRLTLMGLSPMRDNYNLKHKEPFSEEPQLVSDVANNINLKGNLVLQK